MPWDTGGIGDGERFPGSRVDQVLQVITDVHIPDRFAYFLDIILGRIAEAIVPIPAYNTLGVHDTFHRFGHGREFLGLGESGGTLELGTPDGNLRAGNLHTKYSLPYNACRTPRDIEPLHTPGSFGYVYDRDALDL